MVRNQAKNNPSSQTVACMGTAGSFSHTVAKKMHPAATIMTMRTIAEVGSAVADRTADSGVIPLENSVAGTVHESLDAIWRHRLVICEETFLTVSHQLMVLDRSVKLADIRTVVSHPKALRQCRTFLDSLRGVTETSVSDTSEAARIVSETRDRSVAAIGSVEAAAVHHLAILRRNIQDEQTNVTRFVLVRKQGDRNPEGNKISLCATLPHTPGSLHRLLGVFAEAKINLTKIESLPIPDKPWEFRFFIELETAQNDAWHRIIRDASAVAQDIRLIGRFHTGRTL